ncbi:HD domain-containing protein [Kineosporia mesophila]
MLDDEAAGTAALLFEVGTLKLTPRTGWLHAQVRHPESIAEHSHRVSLISAILAALEGADPGRAALMGTLHDTQESRLGDISHVGKAYVKTVKNEQVTADQTSTAAPVVATMIGDAVAEYEAQETPESRVAKDADKLECLLQALEYQRAGNQNVQAWVDSSRAALKTAAALQIADAAMNMTGLEWRQ